MLAILDAIRLGHATFNAVSPACTSSVVGVFGTVEHGQETGAVECPQFLPEERDSTGVQHGNDGDLGFTDVETNV